jgi:hypothetical protein
VFTARYALSSYIKKRIHFVFRGLVGTVGSLAGVKTAGA